MLFLGLLESHSVELMATLYSLEWMLTRNPSSMVRVVFVDPMESPLLDLTVKESSLEQEAWDLMSSLMVLWSTEMALLCLDPMASLLSVPWDLTVNQLLMMTVTSLELMESLSLHHVGIQPRVIRTVTSLDLTVSLFLTLLVTQFLQLENPTLDLTVHCMDLPATPSLDLMASHSLPNSAQTVNHCLTKPVTCWDLTANPFLELMEDLSTRELLDLTAQYSDLMVNQSWIRMANRLRQDSETHSRLLMPSQDLILARMAV